MATTYTEGFLYFIPLLVESEEISDKPFSVQPEHICAEYLNYGFLSKLRRVPYGPLDNPDGNKLVLIK